MESSPRPKAPQTSCPPHPIPGTPPHPRTPHCTTQPRPGDCRQSLVFPGMVQETNTETSLTPQYCRCSFSAGLLE